MSLVMGVAAAVTAGGTFAAAGVLQQRAAARTLGSALSGRLLSALVRQPMWLTGIGLATASYGLQALALSVAPLAVVQPLLVTELVFAIPVSARLSGRSTGLREWIGLLMVAGGVAAVVWSAAAGTVGPGGTPLRWGVVGGSLAAGAVLAALAASRSVGLARANLFAAAAAMVFALSSALLAASVAGFAARGIGELAHPEPYAMSVASLAGMVFIQSSFQAGPLAVAMPMVDWVEPLIAVLLGVYVLRQPFDTGMTHLAALAAGALGALGGIVLLDTSPLVRETLHPARAPAATAGLVLDSDSLDVPDHAGQLLGA